VSSIARKPAGGAPLPESPASATAPESVRTRGAQRHPASAVPSITGLRFSPQGIDAVLVDISESGMLAECAERVTPGLLTVFFRGTFEPRKAEARVVRNSVLSMDADGRLRYLLGIEFTQPIRLESMLEEPPPLVQASPAAVPRVVRNRW
jgi:hypothetical protein